MGNITFTLCIFFCEYAKTICLSPDLTQVDWEKLWAHHFSLSLLSLRCRHTLIFFTYMRETSEAPKTIVGKVRCVFLRLLTVDSLIKCNTLLLCSTTDKDDKSTLCKIIGVAW